MDAPYVKTQVPRSIAYQIEYHERRIVSLRQLWNKRSEAKAVPPLERLHIEERLVLKVEAAARYFHRHSEQMKSAAQLNRKVQSIVTKRRKADWTRIYVQELITETVDRIRESKPTPVARMAAVSIVLDDIHTSLYDSASEAHHSPMCIPMTGHYNKFDPYEFEMVMTAFWSYPMCAIRTRDRKSDTNRVVGIRKKKK